MSTHRRLTAWLIVVSAFALSFGALQPRAAAQPSTALAKPCWPEDKLVGRDTIYRFYRCNDVRALAPGMQRKVACVRESMRAKGEEIALSETWRSRWMQEWLYGYGRGGRPGPIVTNVKDPSTGFHFWGLAVDIIHPTKKWDAPSLWWLKLAHSGEACGVVAGAFWKSFPDRPHLNWAAWESASQRSPLIRRLQAEGKIDSLLIVVGASR